MDDRAFDYLQQAELPVQEMFLAEFQPKRRTGLSGSEKRPFGGGQFPSIRYSIYIYRYIIHTHTHIYILYLSH